jgi:excisionase family DNA binding protein
MAELLKLTEVAQELGISEPTARRYVKTGKLPSIYVGGRYRVRREDVEEFLQRAQVRPGENLPLGGAPSSRDEQARERVRRGPVGEKAKLGDVVSEERLEAFSREINRLYTQLQSGEIDMPTYKERRNAEFGALFAAIDRASTEAG